MALLHSGCPLCGAHPSDADCMDITDQDVLNWSDSIEELYTRLQALKSAEKGDNAKV